MLNRFAKSLITECLSRLPLRIASILISRSNRLVSLAPDRDYLVRLRHPLFQGIRMHLSPAYRPEKILLYEQCYDPKTTSYLANFVRLGDVCIDVGANVGASALPIAGRVGPNGLVYCYEPVPQVLRRLRRNVSANPALMKHIKVVPLGLSDDVNPMAWEMETDNYGNSRLIYLKSPIDSSLGRVDTVAISTLDLEVKRLDIDRIDFIKIDVEGMEFKVLRGGHDCSNPSSQLFSLSPGWWKATLITLRTLSGSNNGWAISSLSPV